MFVDDGNYVENPRAGKRAALVKERGAYVLSIWVPTEPRKQPFQKQGARA